MNTEVYAQPLNVPHQVSIAFLNSVLTTAVEGGIGYWAHCDNVERDDELNVTSVRIEDAEEEGAFEPQVLNHVSVHGGIDLILSGSVQITPTTRWTIANAVANNDPGNIDVEAADAIVQVAAFNEIVFG